MADVRQCGYERPHERHSWEKEGVPPKPQRQYHFCFGIVAPTGSEEGLMYDDEALDCWDDYPMEHGCVCGNDCEPPTWMLTSPVSSPLDTPAGKQPGIDGGKREPHDEKTPEETIAQVLREWKDDRQQGMRMRPLSELIIEALVYKAYFEEAEGALRWLDPYSDSGVDVLARIGVTAIRAVPTPPTEPEAKRRLRSCVEQWPDAETGEYNPACCRFPKSCSATVYDPEYVTERDLEAAPTEPEEKR